MRSTDDKGEPGGEIVLSSESDLTVEQRRVLLGLWCRVAWADEVLRAEEIERISDIFCRLSRGAVSAAEIRAWMIEPPAPPTEKLPAELGRLFVRESVLIASADDEIDERETTLIRELLERCFPAGA
jgi:tellurite resistance protein